MILKLQNNDDKITTTTTNIKVIKFIRITNTLITKKLNK